MTLIRRAAAAMSTLGMRWASPGTKDWAEGVAREVEFVEGDWRALVWAIGSMRVLLERREVPIASLADAYAIAQKFFEKRIRQYSVSYAYAASGILAAVLLYVGEVYQLRTGTLLASLASLFLFHQYGLYRSFVVPEHADLKECVLCYRSELQRDVEFIYGWKSLLSFAVFSSSLDYSLYRDTVQVHGAISIGAWVANNIFFVVMPLPAVLKGYIDLHARRRKIADLDALLVRDVQWPNL